MSCSRWRRFGRCNKDYQDYCLVLGFDPLLSTHFLYHKAYFSLVSLVRTEWDGPRTRPRWWRSTKWPSCKYLTVLRCCPCQMSALNNSDYTSHSLHSWRNRSMWHWNTAATLVSFSSIPFEESFFHMQTPKLFVGSYQRPLGSIAEMRCHLRNTYMVQEDEQKQNTLNHT